jgi:hypothetical protein
LTGSFVPEARACHRHRYDSQLHRAAEAIIETANRSVTAVRHYFQVHPYFSAHPKAAQFNI